MIGKGIRSGLRGGEETKEEFFLLTKETPDSGKG